ncbi:uncharacterized protein JN550_004425 [Neoarthrinium moseri]|uniref:uncharacterized protein n=1 Tax=Neoarthrinium moseri TaxID=1658444 RepID=UPI001FDC5A30|nr:uncharacterized protein JN550_004425 [Neoarthrinium moseri]KAI1871431.1 hypothetical protein JN550_004425 [Neoarthrinium moseri]
MAWRILSVGRRALLLHGTAVPTRRHVATSAAEAAEELTHSFASKTSTRRQLLDGNQLQKLSLTLSRRELHPGLDISEDAPPAGTPLPRGYHLVYFTPGGLEPELGPDGTDRTFNSPAPFTRRMWAGGRMRWDAHNQLRVGELAEERTRLLSAAPKRSRDGSEMVLVDVEKQFWNEKGLALVDQRSWIFRPELKAATEPIADPVQGTVIRGPSIVQDERIDGRDYPQRRLRWSPVGLFRFSALTFNGHKIHYDESWTQSVENHQAQVVHGPLNLISILDYWRDVGGRGDARQIQYRAMSPLYAGDTYHIRTADGERTAQEGKTEILVEKDATVCMKANIE